MQQNNDRKILLDRKESHHGTPNKNSTPLTSAPSQSMAARPAQRQTAGATILTAARRRQTRATQMQCESYEGVVLGEGVAAEG